MLTKSRTPLVSTLLAIAGVLVIVAATSLTLVQSSGEANDALSDVGNGQSESAIPTPAHAEEMEVNPPLQSPVRSNEDGNPFVTAIRSEELQDQVRCGTPPERLTSSKGGPVPVIFDTDFGPDVDDVGALAILHAMADRGETEILGVMVSTSGDFAHGPA